MKQKILILTIVIISAITACSTSSKTANQKIKGDALVLISTSYGDMKVKLYDETPLHKANFLNLVNSGFYDSLNFHRVIKDFMIQGGNPQTCQKVGVEKAEEGELIPAEFRADLFHKKGALAAARTGDGVNPEKKSSGSQFYIVQGKILTDLELTGAEQRSGHKLPEAQKEVYKTIGGTPHLDQNYTVFGEVIEGLNIIDKIASVKTARGDVPVDMVIYTMKLIKK